MRTLAIAILLSIPLLVDASDEWACKEQASQRVGNSIHACGVGEGATENDARQRAFLNAKREFRMVCGSSADCSRHSVTVDPKRTTCDKLEGKYVCHRMLVFEIGEKKQPKIYLGMRESELFENFGMPSSSTLIDRKAFTVWYHVYKGDLCEQGDECFIGVFSAEKHANNQTVQFIEKIKPEYTKVN